MQNLDLILEEDISKTKRPGRSFAKFTVSIEKKAPQQTNAVGCGVYVINFMEQRDLDELDESKFKSHDERARLVLKIVLSGYNKCRSTYVISPEDCVVWLQQMSINLC
ncbi:Ulp1 protease family, C-terminal catalytic domain containing protein [Trema orientale]|uniref:Ulp1 protease family, C-terminal catalytic domain containing protein n=1 Tax=Trema orientale TaxID=63057 RepID=A0A2P5EVL3_TREOI|nr:Ulp1 protease family, C-terminal catalytic domain containing protein [Trema orientale]